MAAYLKEGSANRAQLIGFFGPGRDKLENGAVNAVSFIRGGVKSLSCEYMAEVCITDSTANLDPESVRIPHRLDVFGLGGVIK